MINHGHGVELSDEWELSPGPSFRPLCLMTLESDDRSLVLTSRYCTWSSATKACIGMDILMKQTSANSSVL